MATILFMEDEKNIREVLAEYMQTAGHKVLACVNGFAAKEIVLGQTTAMVAASNAGNDVAEDFQSSASAPPLAGSASMPPLAASYSTPPLASSSPMLTTDHAEKPTSNSPMTAGNLPFDLAVLDIKVPGPDGLEILRLIKSRYGDSIGVIMLTAYDDLPMQLAAFNALADDFVTKPPAPVILLKRIEAVLRRCRLHNARSESSRCSTRPCAGIHPKTITPTTSPNNQTLPTAPTSYLAAGIALQVDNDGYSVYYQQRNLRLTVTEFLLFKTLYDHPGRVYNRDQLITAIFDADYIASERTIDTHVKNLRKKLPADCRSALETVIGLGYRWHREGR